MIQVQATRYSPQMEDGMATFQVAVIAGDGIGPEVMAEAIPLLEWARDRGRDLAWESFPFGANHFLATGESLGEAAFRRIRDQFDAILFGAVGDPRIPDHRHAEEILLRLRQDLRLGVNLRPCRPLVEGVVPLRDVAAGEIQIEVFRENTEGPYCLQGRTEPDRAEDWSLHTESAVECLLGEAFLRAQALAGPLHLAHKANVLKHGHGLWVRVFRRLSAAYPEVRAELIHADALLCALVQDPRRFRVIAGDNFVGDLVSDLLAAFQGGLGVAPSLSYAPRSDFRCRALAEPVHGSAPDLAGRGEANPMGMALSLALLFAHLGWTEEAEAIPSAIRKTLEADLAPRDLGGALNTRELGRAIRARL